MIKPQLRPKFYQVPQTILKVIILWAFLTRLTGTIMQMMCWWFAHSSIQQLLGATKPQY